MADSSYTLDIKARDKASGEIKHVEADVDELTDALGRFDRQSKDTTGTAEIFSGVLAGELAAEGLRSVFEMSKQVVTETARMSREWAESTAEVKRSANAAGMTVREYQRLKFAFQEMGMEGKDLRDVLGTLSERAFDAVRTNARGMQEDFASIGITTDMLARNMHEPQRLLELFSRRLAETENPTERMKGAVSLLGDEMGGQLVGHLNEGGDALGEIGDSMEEAGAIMDEEGVENAVELRDAMKELDRQLLGVKNTFLSEFSPEITTATEKLSTLFKTIRDDGSLHILTKDLREIVGYMESIVSGAAGPESEGKSVATKVKSGGGWAAQAGGTAAMLGGMGMMLFPEPSTTFGGAAIVGGGILRSMGRSAEQSAAEDPTIKEMARQRAGGFFQPEDLGPESDTPTPQPDGGGGDGGDDGGDGPGPQFRLTDDMIRKRKFINDLEAAQVKATGERKIQLEKTQAVMEANLELAKLDQKVQKGLVEDKKAEVKRENLINERYMAKLEAEQDLKDLKEEQQKEERERLKTLRQNTDEARKQSRLNTINNRLNIKRKEVLQAEDPIRQARLEYERRMLEIQKEGLSGTDKQLAKARARLEREQAIADAKARQAREQAETTKQAIRAGSSVLSGAASQAGDIATIGGRSRVDRMSQRAQQAGDQEAQAIRARTEALKEELRIRRERYSAMSQGISLMGKASQQMVTLNQHGLDTKKGFQAAMGGINQLGQAASAAGSSFIEGQKGKALFQGGVQTAQGIAKTALAAMGNPAAGVAAGSHFASAALFYALAAKGAAGAKGAKGGGGGGASKAPGTPSVGGGVDLQKQRQASAKAFAEEMKNIQRERAININVDMSGSTNIEDSITTGRRIQNAIDTGMRDTRRAG